MAFGPRGTPTKTGTEETLAGGDRPAGRTSYNWRATMWLVIGMLIVIGAMGVFMHVIPTPWTQVQPTPTAVATPAPTAQPAVSAPQPAATATPGAYNLATLVANQPTEAPPATSQAQPATVAPGAQATTAPTSVAAVEPTVVGTTTRPPAAPTPTVESTGGFSAAPTVDPALAAEILPAYQHFWEVSDDALATLDGSHLSEVMDGIELVATEKYIDQLRSEGKAAIGTEDHAATILSASSDNAVIHDNVVDHSVYVDPMTREPFPQDQQANPNTEIDATYHLQKIDGVWKVVDES